MKKATVRKSVSRKQPIKKSRPADAPAALDAAVSRLRQALATHGGDIELVSFARGTAKVRLSGACQGCPMAAVTLRETVARYLTHKVPAVKKVVAVD